MKKTIFKDQLLNTLKEKNIKPKSKLSFIIKDILKILSLILISLFSGVLISFIIASLGDFNLLLEKIGILNSILLVFPFVLLLTVFISTFIFYRFFRKIARGYKFSLIYILIINIIIYSFLGNLFFAFDIHSKIENILAEYTNVYDYKIISTQEQRTIDIWMKPESGLLTGCITSFQQKFFTLSDFNNKKWDILIDNTTGLRKDLFLNQNFCIKIEGTQISQHKFKAIRIIPFKTELRYLNLNKK